MKTASDFYVYEHWRPDLDVCFYVGKGRGVRAYVFTRRNRHHNSIASKLSTLGMCIEVRLVRGDLDEATAFDLERQRIAFWRGLDVSLANQTDGGDGASGYRQTVDHRAKIAASHRGKKHSADFCAKVSAGKKGRTHAGVPVGQETRAKISAANKGRKPTPDQIAKLSAALKGRSHSSAHRANISAALTGKRYGPLSVEHKAKIYAVHKGSKRSPETCAKISKAQFGRPVSPETREKIRAALLARRRQLA